MIDTTKESLISLQEAAALLPRGRAGRSVHVSCVLRWLLDGAKAPSGAKVKLDGIRLGARWITSREALQRFAEQLTPDRAEPLPVTRTPARRRQANDQAAKYLDSVGI